MGSLGPSGLSGQGTVSQEWKMRVAGVLDLSVPIPPPVEGGGSLRLCKDFPYSSIEQEGSNGGQTCPGGRLVAEPVAW